MKKYLWFLAIFCIFMVSCGNDAENDLDIIDITIIEPQKLPEKAISSSINEFMAKSEIDEAAIIASIPWEIETDAETITPITSTPLSVNAKSLIVAIDAGHQGKGNSEQEPIGPGAKTTKDKVTSGTSGISTKVPEYQLTLAVSLKLRDELVSRGYHVFMIRETHDVNISNKERAKLATDAKADIFVRIHADGSDNSAVSGILTLSPTSNNPYIPQLYEASYTLSKNILDAMVAVTGAKNRGVSKVDNMSGINWATMPVTIVEMGLMTNPSEDELMQTEEYQMKLAKGIADGIDNYFIDQ